MVLFTVILLALAIAAAQDLDYHETLCDDCDMSILTLEELQELMHCIIDKGPCSDVHASYRKHYPHVVEEACARCNAVQKHTARVFFERVQKELPEDFEYFLNMHDPQRKHFDSFYNAYKDF